MVLVFHLNRRLIRYKFLIFFTFIFLVFIFFYNSFEIAHHLIENCYNEEPIDVVYTWVNGSDPKFLKQLHSYQHSGDQVDSSSQRFDDKNELKFSLRSLEKYAPWIGHVYIVTNGQIPYWLDLDYEKVTVVTHRQIFVEKYDLPTFSSPAIEAHLHRIPGLSKRFIYFNDDIFLRSPVYRDDFISESRGFLIYLAWLMPSCSSECLWLYVADGHCDTACNNPKCQMDGGDCDDTSKAVLGDVIVTSEDFQAPIRPENSHNATNKSATLSIASKLRENINVSELIEVHNKKIILLDKLRRRKLRKRASYFANLRNTAANENVDAYAASLQHTNRMLNDHYGFSVRKVPAHAPILIDKEIMEEVQLKFAKQFKSTSRNRIRSVDDVQFAVAYYYYIIHEKIEMSVEEIFDGFDTDFSGFWSETEIRNVLVKLYDLPVTDESLDHFSNQLMNCSKLLMPNFYITKDLLKNCPLLSSFLKNKLGFRYKYKYEIIRDAEKKHVSFKMLTSNATQVMNQLDDIRKNVKKFVCLNDNLDQARIFDNHVIKRLMLDFYISFFPSRSKFELPEEFRNRFLYMDEYIGLLDKQQKKSIFILILIMLTVFVVFLNFFKRKLCKYINKVFCFGL